MAEVVADFLNQEKSDQGVGRGRGVRPTMQPDTSLCHSLAFPYAIAVGAQGPDSVLIA